MFDEKYSALYSHWVNADAVRVAIGYRPETDSVREELVELALLSSRLSRIAVYYGLLYVVVEGYRELKLSDPALNELLEDERTEKLRRFRNGIFHYQQEMLSKKLTEFMMAEDSEQWVRQVHSAFEKLFFRILPLNDYARAVRRAPQEP